MKTFLEKQGGGSSFFGDMFGDVGYCSYVCEQEDEKST